MSVFDETLSSQSGLGEVSVVVDPFSRDCSVYVPAVTKHPANPVLTKESFFTDVQSQMVRGSPADALAPCLYDVKDLFNPGVAHHDGGFAMLVRYQNASRRNGLFLATSEDGIAWKHGMREIELIGMPPAPEETQRRAYAPDLPDDVAWRPGVPYDPRVTQTTDGGHLVALAVDYDTVAAPGQQYVNVCDNQLYRTADLRRPRPRPARRRQATRPSPRAAPRARACGGRRRVPSSSRTSR